MFRQCFKPSHCLYNRSQKTAFRDKPIGHDRKDFILIAQGVPGTRKQKLKYDAWYRQKSPELHYDETFLYLPSSLKVVYDTINRGQNEWLIQGKQNFSFYRFLGLDDSGQTGMENEKNKCEINLEICSGFGQWFRERVSETPLNQNVRWIACELKFRRCVSILGRLHHYLEPNVIREIPRVICAEASFGLDNLFPDASCDNVYIRFPEPWTKAQDAHKRIISHSFGLLLAWKIKRHGTLTVTTDDPIFRDWTIQVMWQMRELWNFEGVAEEQRSAEDMIDFDETLEARDEGGFENLLRERGCTIYHLKYVRA